MSYGPQPWLQESWDARAAGNFMAGGAGGGLAVFTALAGGPRWSYALAAALVALGLFSVFLEIGRPLRAANVVRQPGKSWMAREALVAPLLLAACLAAWAGVAWAGGLAALAALAFVYCQARILQGAKGIPAWREPLLVPLLVATGLAEGGGIHLWITGRGSVLAWAAFLIVLAARFALWSAWRARLRTAARALAQIDAAGRSFKTATLVAAALALAALLAPVAPLVAWALGPLAGIASLAGGLWFKFTLVTRAGFNQGFAIPHLPVRGVRRG
jgi:phenylacetyl-CoA:acceptor oxidoreductase subunit 2